VKKIARARIWLCLFAVGFYLLFSIPSATAQTRLVPTRVAYSALSAGIGMLWLTHEQGIFRKHGLDSNLVYIRSGTTAVQAFLAGEIQLDPRKETEL